MTSGESVCSCAMADSPREEDQMPWTADSRQFCEPTTRIENDDMNKRFLDSVAAFETFSDFRTMPSSESTETDISERTGHQFQKNRIGNQL
jgi:hypothetical protein